MYIYMLTNYGTGSVLSCVDSETLQSIGAIIYTRKIHRYESKADFDTINTELQTYGQQAARDIFNYFEIARKAK